MRSAHQGGKSKMTTAAARTFAACPAEEPAVVVRAVLTLRVVCEYEGLGNDAIQLAPAGSSACRGEKLSILAAHAAAPRATKHKYLHNLGHR
jgi:hypothetical protein